MTEDETWAHDGDPWAGMVDDDGFPIEIPDAAASAAADVAAGADAPTLFNLPEEFWGSREIFKLIRQQARADGTGPDAVLGAVLARASAMASHEMQFDSGKPGRLNLFVNIVGPTGIGKTEAMRSAQRLLRPPAYLCSPDGVTDTERFRDGVVVGTGEGLAEVYMGVKEVDTGEFYRAGPNKGDPKTKPVRTQVRHNAFLFMDEGEALTKMLERRGATVGTSLRSAWTGIQLGAANAQESTTRFIPDGTYSMGILIGWQPTSAMALIKDSAGGTPQRFLWLSTIDPEMPEDPDERPEPFRAPLADHDGRALTGTVHFPAEIKKALRLDLRAKHVDGKTVEELHSHEPLMRCKVSALLCLLDGRRMVNRDDWWLAGMIWQVSCAVRDRLVQFGRQAEAARALAEVERHADLAQAAEVARLQVTQDVERVAVRIARKVHEDGFGTKRKALRDNFGRDKRLFAAAEAYARQVGWLDPDNGSGDLHPGRSQPIP